MTACNKFSESIVHTACRRSNFETVQFLISHGADANITDDYGRSPLHDACWRVTPDFDMVTLLLDANFEQLRWCDVRGSTPLCYVSKDNWLSWCAYLFCYVDRYWPYQSRTIFP
jgi:ankyrin repeat protein